MASISINSFSLTVLPANQVRLNVQFTVTLTPTELSLGIPCRAAVRLMERDGARDPLSVFADWTARALFENDDDPGTDWFAAGLFHSNTTSNFSEVIPRNSLPGGPGAEQWYVVGGVAPDIRSEISFSRQADELVVDLN